MQRRDWWAAGVAALVLVAVCAFVSARGAAPNGAHEQAAAQQAAVEKAIQIRNRLPGTNAILFLVEDGKKVKKGDLLVELDDTALRDELMRLKMEAEEAKSTLVMVERQRRVQQRPFAAKAPEAAVKVAALRLEQMRAEVQMELRVIEREIEVAAHALKVAQSRQQRLAELSKANQVPAQEVEAARLEVLEAEVELERTRGARELLVGYTKPLREAELELEIEQARAAQQVVRQEAETALIQSDGEQRAVEADYEMVREKLKRLEDRLVNSKIHAPEAGTVRRARYRVADREEKVPVDVGTIVRERQMLLSLEPDSK